MTTVGLLYPGYGAEDDFPALEERLRDAGHDVSLPLVHTSVGEDAHRVDALLDLGGHERLVVGARVLAAEHRLDSLIWACTSGSFVFGWEGAQRQVEALAEATGLPTSSTSLAFVSACRALGLTKVTVAASYPEDVADHFGAFPPTGRHRGDRDGESRHLLPPPRSARSRATRWSPWSPARPVRRRGGNCWCPTPRCTHWPGCPTWRPRWACRC